jgi:hypothetical protein
MKANTVALLILLAPVPVFASVRVSEIMYDVSGADSGREWIEVVNQGTMPVDLSTYKVFEGGVNHKIVAIKGDALLASGGVAIIADNPTKFLVDWPNTPGAILDSAFSLSNSGETIGIKDRDLKTEDMVTFVAKDASGNGLSLSRGDDGQFIPTKPTPGIYVGVPTKVTIAPATPTVTQKPQQGLQTGVPTPSVAQAVFASNPTEDMPIESAPMQANTGAPVWTWALGALGLSLLGVGGVYALKLHAPTDTTETRAAALRAMQQEAATYEIIE